MKTRLVDEVPGGLSTARPGRVVAVPLGVLLICCGGSCLVPDLLVLPGLIGYVFDGDPVTSQSTDVTNLVGLLVLVAVSYLAVWGGLRLLRGKRRLGLYLRKFGFVPGTQTVSHAMASAAGRAVRLVTLDGSQPQVVNGDTAAGSGVAGTADRGACGVLKGRCGFVGSCPAAGAGQAPLAVEVEPIGAARQRAGVVFAVLGLVLPVAALIGMYLVFYRESQVVVVNADGYLPPVWSRIVYGLSAYTLMLSPALIVAGVLGAGARRAARRVQRGAGMTIVYPQAVDIVAFRLGRLARRIVAPRLTVVRVDEQYVSFWRRAVFGLAAVSDVVIIDVSVPSEALIWELEKIKPLFDGRHVLVGARDRLSYLELRPSGGGCALIAHTSALLVGEQVLRYGPDPDDRRRFARSLRRALVDPARLNRPWQPGAPQRQ